MLKKKLAMLLAVVMMLGCLAGCGSKEEPAPEKEQAPTQGEQVAAPEKEEDPYEYPESGVLTSVIAYSAGGTADNLIRKLSAIMAEHLDANSNCINVTGGSASVAGLKVQSESNGKGEQAIGYLLSAPGSWKALGYTKDVDWSDWYNFAAAQAPIGFCVSKNSEFKTLDDLVAAAQANPGSLKWGNAGIGSTSHLSGQMLLDALEVDALAVPFGGGREAATNVMAGELDWSWSTLGDVMDLLESGDLICLASTSEEEIEIESVNGTYKIHSLCVDHPDVVATASALVTYGMALPRDTDPQAVAAFAEAFEYAVNTDEFKEFADSLALAPTCIYGEEIDKLVAAAEASYAWGLYDQGLAAEGVSPADFGIARPEDFDYEALDLTSVNPWP